MMRGIAIGAARLLLGMGAALSFGTATLSPAAAQATPEMLKTWQESTKDVYYATDVGAVLRFAWESGQLVGRTEVDPNPSDDIPGRLIGQFTLLPGGTYKKAFGFPTLRGSMPLPSGGNAALVLVHRPNVGILIGGITMPDGQERSIIWLPQTVDNSLPPEHRGKPFRQAGWAEVLLTKVDVHRISGTDVPMLTAELAVRNKGADYKELVRPHLAVALVSPDGRSEETYAARLKPIPPNAKSLDLHTYVPVALPNGGAMLRVAFVGLPAPRSKLLLKLDGKPTDVMWDIPVNLTTAPRK